MGSDYDFCKYEAYEPYERQTAEEKHAKIMRRVLEDTTGTTYLPLHHMAGQFAEDVRMTFEAKTDVFPQRYTHHITPRKKYIHTVGVVAPIRFVSTGDHPYTGLFEGADYGLVRLSSAVQPNPLSGFTPGAAFKFFRNGRPSANFVAMPALSAQTCGDRNFFSRTYRNHVPNPGWGAMQVPVQTLAKKFFQASYCPLMVGISDLASGAPGKGGNFPFMLELQPMIDVNCNWCGTLLNSTLAPESYYKCLEDFGPASTTTEMTTTTLFAVTAIDAPGAEPRKIGSIELTGPFTRSTFGDEELFFRHQAMEEDFKQKPEWLQDLQDMGAQCGLSKKWLESPLPRTERPGVADGCMAVVQAAMDPMSLLRTAGSIFRSELSPSTSSIVGIARNVIGSSDAAQRVRSYFSGE